MEQATMQDPAVQEAGISIVVDFRGATMAQMSHFGTADLVRGIQIWKHFAVKPKRVFILNASIAHRLAIKAVLSALPRVRKKVVWVSKSGAELLADVRDPQLI